MNSKDSCQFTDAEYRKHVEAEIKHYSDIFAGQKEQHAATLFQPVPRSWIEVEKRASELIKGSTGDDLNGHIVRRLQSRVGVRLVSLGSGPGGIELAFARQAAMSEIDCYDFNADLLEIGRQKAASEDLRVGFFHGDLNRLQIPAACADIVLCHASLHHVIELENLAEQIRRALRPGGELIVVDVITDNGYRMWPETRSVVRDIWATLPPRFRINHTAYHAPRLDESLWEADTSESGMECIRSKDILPVLNKNFRTVCYQPYFSICRRFLDTMYGPNFDLLESLDVALLNWIWELDVHYIRSGQLRPETFFGIYCVE